LENCNNYFYFVVKYYELFQKAAVTDQNLSDIMTFKKEFEKRALFLMKEDIRLYVIYQEA